MRLQVIVTLNVTCLDDDGKEVTEPGEGTEAHDDLLASIRAGIKNALTDAEADGFNHPREATTSVLVEAIGVPFPAVRDPDQLVPVLREFVEDINYTGGLIADEEGSGLYCPTADPTWVDLAVTYEHACEALGVDPHYPAGEEDDGA
jgi:hypothetical protein